MDKMNPLALQINNLFNLKSFNELKKDQTNIKIFKNSSFDSSFNSVQSLNTNLSHILLLPSPVPCAPHHSFETLNPASLDPKGGEGLGYGGWVSLSPLVACSLAPRGSAILRAIRTIRLNRDEWKLIRYINLMEKKIRSSPLFGSPLVTTSYSSISSSNTFIYNNIINKNILLRNMKYNFLKSTLSSILKKKIRRISEILEDKPIKNYVLYSYLKYCIFTSPHLNVPALSPLHLHLRGREAAGGVLGRSKLSLNKYKGRKFGSFINYNKIIGYKFNSTFYQAYPNSLAPLAAPTLTLPNPVSLTPALAALAEGLAPLQPKVKKGGGINNLEKNRGNIYIKDIYKLLFYLFKSMYCLISKPVLKYTNDKITIQLFYYLNIPKKKVFRFFSISYINSIKKKWLAHIEKKKSNFIYPSPFPLTLPPLGKARERGNSLPALGPALAGKVGSIGGSPGRGNTYLPRGNTKIYIRWKLRKAISRFKNKNIPCLGGLGGVNNLLFKLRKYNLTAKAVYQNKFKLICAILSNKFNKPVELQLIRLHHPYHDSNILVNLLSLNIKNKRKKARVAIQKIYNKKPVKFLNDPNLNNPALPTTESLARGTGYFIPAFLSGLNIKIAGRLMGEPIIPRITTKVYSKGASATGKVNYLDVARITKKNRKGAYTIKITSGQNFF